MCEVSSMGRSFTLSLNNVQHVVVKMIDKTIGEVFLSNAVDYWLTVSYNVNRHQAGHTIN